jgi:hypothetical protein
MVNAVVMGEKMSKKKEGIINSHRSKGQGEMDCQKWEAYLDSAIKGRRENSSRKKP